jgi:putrescine transport system ATP-binding protein
MDIGENRGLTAAAVELPPALVELRGISKHFDGVAAVRDVNLRIRRGEIFAILGPSGCGKSTLLRVIAGLDSPSTGEIFLEGQSLSRLPAYRRPINMMFQSYALFPHMTVEQNVAFGLKQDRLEREVVRERVDRMLELVRMSEFRRRKPAQLSGGQQQRAALARSLAKEPRLLLLDEPMGALDRKLRAEMQFEVAEIIRRVRVTCVMVTHDQEEAMVMADRLALMDRGSIVQLGKPAEVYDFPNSRFSAEFLGDVNLFSGRVSAVAEELVVIESPDIDGSIKAFAGESLSVEAEVAVAVRPEKLRLLDQPGGAHNNRSEAVVEDVAYAGSHTRYHLRLPTGHLVTALQTNEGRQHRLEHGATVSVGWDIRDGVLVTS